MNDLRPMPKIKKTCWRCFRGLPVRDVQLVSPNGVAHHGRDGGDTDCGIDATGGKWWWRA